MRTNKKKFLHIFLLLALLTVVPRISFSQTKEVLLSVDSAKTVTAIIDSTAAGNEKVKKITIYSPKKAAIRSAILPGWGQVYNKKYWKLPIVYGALGISAGIFIYNLKWYKRTRFAYKVLVTKDTNNFPNVHPDLQFLITRNDQNTLGYARDQYRRDIDYSALFFIILWGLNVVDAAVDSHLKAFDVSPDLSLNIKPGYSEMAGTNGLSLVLNIGKR